MEQSNRNNATASPKPTVAAPKSITAVATCSTQSNEIESPPMSALMASHLISDLTQVIMETTAALGNETSAEKAYQNRIEELSQQLVHVKDQLANQLREHKELLRRMIETNESHTKEIDLLKTKFTTIHDNKVEHITAANEKQVKDLKEMYGKTTKSLSDRYESFSKALKETHIKQQDELRNRLEQKAEDEHRELRQANQKLAIETKSLRKKVEGHHAMKEEVEPLRQEVRELRNELTTVKKDLVAANAQLSKQKARVTEVQANKQTISDLEVELSVVKKSLSATKAQLSTERNNLQEAQNSKEALLEELKATNNKLAVAQKSIDACKIQLSDAVDSSKKTIVVLQDKFASVEKDFNASKLQLSKETKMTQRIKNINEYLVRSFLVAAFGSKFLGEGESEMKEGVKKLAEDKEDMERLIELGRKRVEELRGEVKHLTVEGNTKEPLVKIGVCIRQRFMEQSYAAKHRDYVENVEIVAAGYNVGYASNPAADRAVFDLGYWSKEEQGHIFREIEVTEDLHYLWPSGRLAPPKLE